MHTVVFVGEEVVIVVAFIDDLLAVRNLLAYNLLTAFVDLRFDLNIVPYLKFP